MTNGGRRAVFLDRDGVLVIPEMRDGRSFAPRRLEDFCIYDDAPRALAALKQAGFLLVVVTNQPDIGNGFVSAETVEAMHDRLRAALPIDRIEMCPHSQSDRCACRKPKPGMLLRAAEIHGIDLSASIMVGDRAGDIEAGEAAGCHTVFIDLNYVNEPKPNATWTARSISELVDVILGECAQLRDNPDGQAT